MGHKLEKRQWRHNLPTWRHCQVFWFAVFLLPSLVTGPSFMSISWLVLDLWQFLFIKDWPEIRKSELPPTEFCPISRDWGELGVPNVAGMSLLKSYWMIQNARVTAFTVSELTPIHIGVKFVVFSFSVNSTL